MTKHEKQTQIEKALEGLKDFQKSTVDYLFHQFYKKEKNRMLVADEVGLGKTIVAKGLIAKAFERHLDSEKKTDFHVVYICSNQALAKQNLRKLNFLDNQKVVSNDLGRLIFLAYKQERNETGFQLSTLTPSTSFKLTRSYGWSHERALIYTFLTKYDVFKKKTRKNGLTFLFQGTMERKNWQRLLKEFDKDHRSYFQDNLITEFRQKLLQETICQEQFPKIYEAVGRKSISFWEVLKILSENLNKRRKKPNENYYYEVISFTRQILTKLAVKFLNADLFILDEFQRFKTLIQPEDDSPATQLATEVFSQENAKVLMLSATPYKPYTTSFEQQEGEEHYGEFKTVLKFLAENNKEDSWQGYEANRTAFFQFIRQPELLLKSLEEARNIKKNLEEVHRNLMVRTERNIVATNKNGLIQTKGVKVMRLDTSEIQNFIHIDRIAQRINDARNNRAFTPLEFAKSAPYPMSFLQNYKIQKELHDLRDDPVFLKSIAKEKDAWLDLKAIHQYKILNNTKGGLSNFPNEKLNTLLRLAVLNKDETQGDKHQGFRLLWVPPTLPYYPLKGAYKTSKNFSKVLVFSSWAMVPRMVSSLISYEAERLTVGDDITKTEQEKRDRTYFTKEKEGERTTVRHPVPLLTFKKKDEMAQNMSNLTLLYPSITLAKLYDPRDFLGQPLPVIKATIRKKLSNLVVTHALKNYETNSGDSEKWYWALPMILDKLGNNGIQLNRFLTENNLFNDKETARGESIGKQVHHQEMRAVFYEDLSNLALGRMPKDLLETMVELTIGAPSILAYRGLENLFSEHEDNIVAAFSIANGLLTLFNKPESIAIVRLEVFKMFYWRAVINYCINGCLQAVLDEFMYLLYDCENYQERPIPLANHLALVVGIQTSSVNVEGFKEFKKGATKKMRSHFAISFGQQKMDSITGSKRAVSIRESFNSPFRPFVLTTTSIGQEGLDFHYYCRKIMHWNLPSNAIDLEQREGRINRYKGLVIRQNVAKQHQQALDSTISNQNVWKQLFQLAVDKKTNTQDCDLTPFWHINDDKAIEIERIIPLHPLSRDIPKLETLLEVLGLYRLTFGQPRQEELVKALANADISEEELAMISREMVQVLAPVVYWRGE